jgi:hypothetical protein
MVVVMLLALFGMILDLKLRYMQAMLIFFNVLPKYIKLIGKRIKRKLYEDV